MHPISLTRPSHRSERPTPSLSPADPVSLAPLTRQRPVSESRRSPSSRATFSLSPAREGVCARTWWRSRGCGPVPLCLSLSVCVSACLCVSETARLTRSHVHCGRPEGGGDEGRAGAGDEEARRVERPQVPGRRHCPSESRRPGSRSGHGCSPCRAAVIAADSECESGTGCLLRTGGSRSCPSQATAVSFSGPC